MVGKPDSLGFTRKTATPQPSTKPGTLPAASCDSGSYDGIFHVFGYLVSPNNPSLAP